MNTTLFRGKKKI